MRIALMADGDVGLGISRYLVESFPQDVAIVVTIGENDISALADAHSIPRIVWSQDDSVAAALRSADPDLGLLGWWPHIVKSPVTHIPRLGWINTHPSLLPHNRGKHYNFWALVEEAPFGVTLHFIDEGVDAGDIVAQRPVSYDWTDTGESLHTKAKMRMLDLFTDTYPSLRTGTIPRIPQNPSEGSSHRGIEIGSASRIILDDEYTARDLINLLRARTFQGYPSCVFEDDDILYAITVNIRRLQRDTE